MKKKRKARTLTIANSKYAPLDHPAIRAALQPFGVEVDAALAAKVRAYTELLLRWNQKINLTAITEPHEILARHFGESMFAAPFLAGRAGLLVDIGSGAGFPGLALKLVRPQMEVHLIEPNLKKAAFLAEVVRALDLDRVSVVKSRTGELPPSEMNADYVTARAVGDLENLVGWAHEALKTGGVLLLWLGAEDAEIIACVEGWDWKARAAIPAAENRVLLVGRKP